MDQLDHPVFRRIGFFFKSLKLKKKNLSHTHTRASGQNGFFWVVHRSTHDFKKKKLLYIVVGKVDIV